MWFSNLVDIIQWFQCSGTTLVCELDIISVLSDVNASIELIIELQFRLLIFEVLLIYVHDVARHLAQVLPNMLNLFSSGASTWFAHMKLLRYLFAPICTCRAISSSLLVVYISWIWSCFIRLTECFMFIPSWIIALYLFYVLFCF